MQIVNSNDPCEYQLWLQLSDTMTLQYQGVEQQVLVIAFIFIMKWIVYDTLNPEGHKILI